MHRGARTDFLEVSHLLLQQFCLQLIAVDLVGAALSFLPAFSVGAFLSFVGARGLKTNSGQDCWGRGRAHLYLVVSEWGMSCFDTCCDRPIILLWAWSCRATAALYVGLCAVVMAASV
jgi:hypothetical protein